MDRKQSITRILTFTVILITGILVTIACDDNSNKTNSPQSSDSSGVASGMHLPNDVRADTTLTFEAKLEGDSEIPEVKTKAAGAVKVTVVGDSIHVAGEFSGLSSAYTTAHIYKGADDENGDPVLALKADVADSDTSGSWHASYILNKQQLKALKAESLYVNVHSANHKSGEIRGQLSSDNF